MAKSPKALQQVRLEGGPIPLYHQLEQHLLGRVESGEFASNGLLPSEEQLCESYGVSRITVRKALDCLTRQGTIIRRRGIGSYVAERNAGVRSVRLTGSLDEFLQSAAELRSQVISLGPCPANAEVVEALDLTEGETVTRLEIATSTKEGVIGHLVIFFPEEIGRNVTVEDVTKDVPVIRLIEQRLSLPIVRADQLIMPDIASVYVGGILGVSEHTPILRVRRIYYTTTGRPVEAAYIHYHPERYRYAVELRSRLRVV